MPGRVSATILFITMSVVAAPAAAQYDGRSRAERIADEIARQVEATAGAIGTVTDSVHRSVDSVRFRGAERFAVDRCVPYVERYGRMQVDDVRRYSRSSWRVFGTVNDGGGLGGGYNGSYGLRRGYGHRSFTCTVREDGRVKVKTQKIRRY